MDIVLNIEKMKDNFDKISDDNEQNIKTINIAKENPILSVFSKESLLYKIGIFLTYEERKSLYSINKKANSIFRNNIKEIPSKILLKFPELVKRFPKLKKFEYILKEKELKV